MINVNDLYTAFLKYVNKFQNSGYVSPSDFNYIMNYASRQLFDDYYGQPSQTRYDKPTDRMAYAHTEQISEKLSVFVVPNLALVLNGSGVAPIPADMCRATALTNTFNLLPNPIVRVEHDRKAMYLQSTIDNPTAEFPIYIQYNTNYQFYPISITGVQLSYLQFPPDGVWGYTIVSNRPVYNAGTSTNLLWEEDNFNELINRMGSVWSQSVKDNENVQYSEAKIQSGS